MSNPPHFLVVSYCTPLRTSGTPVVVRKFLENFQSNEVILIGRPVRKNERVQDYRPHYPVYTIPTPPVGARGERIWRLLSVLFGFFIGLFSIHSRNVKAILALYRDESSLLTGYLIHMFSKIPLFVYFCDLYLENYPTGINGKVARWLQPLIFKSADQVFVLTEAMREYFQKEYNIDPIVLPHCNNEIAVHNPKVTNISNPFRIGYLGSVNIDRISSLKILCNSIKGNDQFFLNYFTPTQHEILQKEGLIIENSHVKFIASNDQVIQELGSCDLLYLPVYPSQAFSEREWQLITGFPTKAIEYLLCQKPVLVHSKKEYYVSKFFTNFECGYVVDGGEKDIYNALVRIKNDLEFRRFITANTSNAIDYFQGKKIADKFRSIYRKYCDEY